MSEFVKDPMFRRTKEKLEILFGERGDKGNRAVRQKDLDTLSATQKAALAKLAAALDALDVDTLARLTGAAFTGAVTVPDAAYDASTWDGSTEVPTKNAVRDKFEALFSGLGNYADDSAAASGGVAIGKPYRNGSQVCVRVS
jgi:hypothetical protein